MVKLFDPASAAAHIITGKTLLDILAGNDGRPVDAPMLGSTKMPKLIHQSWKTEDIPGVYGLMRQSWIDTYPDWVHVLWTDQDNDRLVKNYYPEYLNLYNGYEAGIYRADMVRGMYMHTFGGIYVDLDFDAYKSLNPLLEKELQHRANAVFLGRMADPEPADHPYLSRSTIPNAFMASTPHHPFWPLMLINTRRAWDTNELTPNGKYARERPEYATGPVVLHTTYNEWVQKEDKNVEEAQILSKFPVIVLAPEYMYPFAWYKTKDASDDDIAAVLANGSKDFDLEERRKAFNNGIAYACTYWAASWQPKGWSPGRKEKVASSSGKDKKETPHAKLHELRMEREYDALR